MQVSQRGGTPSQLVRFGPAPSLFPTPIKEKPQGRNRSAPAIAAGPDPASCCWLCVGKMADSVEERRPTLHSPISVSICQRGRINAERSHTLFTPCWNVTRKLTRAKLAAFQCRTLACVVTQMRQRKVVRKNVLSQERCEALLVSLSNDQIAASETKAGSAHTAHDPALVSLGPTGLTAPPHYRPSKGCIETMRSYAVASAPRLRRRGVAASAGAQVGGRGVTPANGDMSPLPINPLGCRL